MESGIIDLSITDIETLKVETKYCVDKTTHDMNVKESVARGYKSIDAANPNEKITEPIALVCSGTTLKDTWEQVKNFSKIITCSGAHDFLIERGIVPTYHMETDPRAHKALFTKNPNKNVTYLIASNCHADVFDSLNGYEVRLWHVYGNHPEDLPRGHWAITGGSNVGLRAMVLARVLGYVNIHIFGMDCSSDGSLFHANYHPNEPKVKGHKQVKVGDRTFDTCDVFLEYARQFFKETLILSDTQVTLYGDGLLQALAAQKMADPNEIKKRADKINSMGLKSIAFSQPVIISDEYLELNKKLHSENRNYGLSGARHAETVIKLKKTLDAESVLDYGSGKGTLAKNLPFPIWEYDPCVTGKDLPPRPADLVVCTDVLEHIEPDFLENVLIDLVRATKKIGYFVISTRKAEKVLADGRNAHLIVESANWWEEKLSNFFNVAKSFDCKHEVHLIVYPKTQK